MESQFQRKVLKIVTQCGLLGRAVAYRGRKGCPDVVVIDPPTVWLELKTPTGTAMAHQKREHKRMEEHNACVYIVRDLPTLKAIIEKHYPQAARAPALCDVVGNAAALQQPE